MRKGLIKQIVAKYIQDYTCATMSDIYAEMCHEQAMADAYIWGKILELGLKPCELRVALAEVCDERKAADKPFIYNENVISWIKND